MDKFDKYRLMLMIFSLFTLIFLFRCESLKAAEPRAKFYDFSEQLIDGEIKKPTALYMDVRQKVKFQRLLRLKRNFHRDLMKTARERVFK
jgi:hypothetical protein|tara:strand:- start:372 stop:641 length:270 start_codon:yes stop_codon:yes gene_type:complete